MNARIHRDGALFSVLLLAVLMGCNDNKIGPEQRNANRPPETILASGPPDNTSGTSYRVHLFWSGSDPDGTISHYDFIMVDHAAVKDSIAAEDTCGAVAPRNQVVVCVPAPDDPRWTATNANDTLIVTRADTLRSDPAPPPDSDQGEIQRHNEFVRLRSFERWHTFFVRAVDNEGMVDVQPDYRSFNSQTLAPDVSIGSPVDPNQDHFTGPMTLVFNWSGSDPVGDGTVIDPIASRWTLQPVRVTSSGAYVGYPDMLYTLPDAAWTQWTRWDARDKSGVRAIVRNLESAGSGGKGFYLFAVQAMDEAGAVTSVFDAVTSRKNNVVRIMVNNQVGPLLTVQDKYLGTFNFANVKLEGDSAKTRPVVLDIAASQPITFRWRADAKSYGGDVVAYRYGWNIRNPSSDEEWEQNWCGTCKAAPTRTFNSGTQRFFLETLDNAETITHAEFELVVHQVTRSRDLLFVDDSSYPPDDRPVEALEDERWAAVIDSMQALRPFQFDASRDIYDVEDNSRFPPPLSKVFDYKTVVWAARNYSSNALRAVAFFFDPFVLRNQNATPAFNFLSIYIENGGEFWLSGASLSYILWPLGDNPNFNDQVPANITGWDDPLQPHPSIDSVGTTGFLWKMGVEVVDIGAGSHAPPQRRDKLDHACLGFRRATPGGWEKQRFVSSLNEGHQHALYVQTADVERPLPQGQTYTTEPMLEHTHALALTSDQLHELGRGEVVIDSTATNTTLPAHKHAYRLIDQVGLWGAPALLEPDEGTWPLPPRWVNPGGGRYDVEIFNMPTYMASRQPPLSPEPGISVALYTYVSVTRESSDTGMLYPLTADGQPSVLLRRAEVNSPYYSRAICGFEPWRLGLRSHVALADYILSRHFRLGTPE